MKEFEGYPNSATWNAAMLLQNDSAAYFAMTDLVKKGGLVAKALRDLFVKHRFKLDSWIEGQIDWDYLSQDLRSYYEMECGITDTTTEETPSAALPIDAVGVLKTCIVEGNLVKLPDQLPKPLYDEVAAIFKKLGGQWNKKRRGHVFDDDPSDLIDYVITTGKVQKPEKFGYFPTPRELAESVVERADIRPGMTVLEPEAGTGGLADIIAETIGSKELIRCVELQEKNAKVLQEKRFKTLIGDFLEMCLGTLYDRVVMNPPFEKQADIKHVMHAWKYVRPGGRLVAIMSAGALYRSDRRATEFREFVEQYGGILEENPAGSFKSSGTMTSTVTLVIDKPDDYPLVEAIPEVQVVPATAQPIIKDTATVPRQPKQGEQQDQLPLWDWCAPATT